MAAAISAPPGTWGYALLPPDAGCEPPETQGVRAVWTAHEEYIPNEWDSPWTELAEATRLVRAYNARFAQLYTPQREDPCVFDELEIAHQELTLEAVLRGLVEARPPVEFVLLWFTDADDDRWIIRSIRELNSAEAMEKFLEA